MKKRYFKRWVEVSLKAVIYTAIAYIGIGTYVYMLSLGEINLLISSRLVVIAFIVMGLSGHLLMKYGRAK